MLPLRRQQSIAQYNCAADERNQEYPPLPPTIQSRNTKEHWNVTIAMVTRSRTNN